MENYEEQLKEIKVREKKLRNRTIWISVAVPVLTIFISFFTSLLTIQSELDIDKLNYTQEQINKILENNDLVEIRKTLKFLIDAGLIGDNSNQSKLLEALDENLDNEYESVSRYLDGVIYFDKAKESTNRDTIIKYYEKAIEELRWSCDLNPNNKEALYILGSSYFNIGLEMRLPSFYEMALVEYDNALELDASMVNTRIDKAKVLTNLKRYDEMCQELNKINEADTINMELSNIATYESYKDWCSKNGYFN